VANRFTTTAALTGMVARPVAVCEMVKILNLAGV
jgi:hypothetical protein